MTPEIAAVLERIRLAGIGAKDYALLRDELLWAHQARERFRWRPISEIHKDLGNHVAYRFKTEEMEIVYNCSHDFDETHWDICVPVPYLSHDDIKRLKSEMCPGCLREQIPVGVDICSGPVGRPAHTCGKEESDGLSVDG